MVREHVSRVFFFPRFCKTKNSKTLFSFCGEIRTLLHEYKYELQKVQLSLLIGYTLIARVRR